MKFEVLEGSFKKSIKSGAWKIKASPNSTIIPFNRLSNSVKTRVELV